MEPPIHPPLNFIEFLKSGKMGKNQQHNRQHLRALENSIYWVNFEHNAEEPMLRGSGSMPFEKFTDKIVRIQAKT